MLSVLPPLNIVRYFIVSCTASTSRQHQCGPWSEQLKRLKRSLRGEQKNWCRPPCWAKTLTTNYIHISVSAFPAAPCFSCCCQLAEFLVSSLKKIQKRYHTPNKSKRPPWSLPGVCLLNVRNKLAADRPNQLPAPPPDRRGCLPPSLSSRVLIIGLADGLASLQWSLSLSLAPTGNHHRTQSTPLPTSHLPHFGTTHAGTRLIHFAKSRICLQFPFFLLPLLLLHLFYF